MAYFLRLNKFIFCFYLDGNGNSQPVKKKKEDKYAGKLKKTNSVFPRLPATIATET